MRVNSSTPEIVIEQRQSDLNISSITNHSVIDADSTNTVEGELHPSFLTSEAELTDAQINNSGATTETDRIAQMRTQSQNLYTDNRNINSNFKQGEFGNCVGVAIFQNFARFDLGLEYLNSLVQKDGYNNFVVSLPGFKNGSISISLSIIRGNEVIKGNDYVEAICCAMYKDAGNLDDAGNFKQGQITDRAHISMNERGSFLRLTGLEPNCSHGDIKHLRGLEQALNEGRCILATTAFDKSVSSINLGIVPNHAYGVVGIDLEKDEIVLKNPWYDSQNKTVTMSISDFQKYNHGMNLLEMFKNESTGEILFRNPEFGVKPGEIDYGDYFDIIGYEPTNQDYLDYISQNKDELKLDDTTDLSFWEMFDNKGYKKFIKEAKNGQIRFNVESMENNLPTAYLLKSENRSPLGLVKFYLKNGRLPNFQSAELQSKSSEIEEWVKSQIEEMKYPFQIQRHEKIVAEREAQRLAEEQRRIEEEQARIKAEEEARQLQILQRKETAISEFNSEAFNTRPDGFTRSVVPSELAVTQDLYRDLSGYRYNSQTRTISFNNWYGGNSIIKFYQNGRIISYVEYSRERKVIEQKKYTYNSDGTRIIEDNYGKEVEIYNENGQLLQTRRVSNKYPNEFLVRNYIHSDSGECLPILSVSKRLSLDNNGNSSIDVTERKFDYTFADDGAVASTNETFLVNGNVNYSHKYVEMSADETAEYYNGNFVGVRYKGSFYDINGNKRSTFSYDRLPLEPNVTPEQLLEIVKNK